MAFQFESEANNPTHNLLNLEQKMNLKELIDGNAEFLYYKDSQLWYRTHNGELTFPVPIEDVGNATFKREEKGLLMMRYIRKYLNFLEGNLK